MLFPTLEGIVELPRPFDRDRARVGRERWLAAAGNDEAARALADDPVGGALLDAVFGNSPFLSHCMVRRPERALTWAQQGPEAAIAAAHALIENAADNEKALMAALREARNGVALAVALADIAGIWPLERITGALSSFAERAVDAALGHLLARAAAAGQITSSAQTRDSGIIVLGLGKLGGGELNYSSDIDIMVLWDEERFQADAPLAVCVRLVRGLVRLLEERTAEGYALRTDLRLRPDPGATPLALSVDAAELYYESLGQNWERAALIKARAVAGDIEAGEAFLARLTPFIWRRHLDFAAIQDIHSIKRQIHAHKGGAQIAVAGHNVKLGRGGIREIEFFAQTQQLIFGGREASLRTRATCRALSALAEAQRIAPFIALDLTDAYGELRRIEHRLQMIDDAQTHSVPESEEGLAHIACFLGHPDVPAFAAHLTGILQRVEAHYADLFEESDPLSGEAGGAFGNLVFTGTEDDPDTLATLARLGFADPSAVAAIIRGWHHGRVRAMRSPRARQILTELMPRLLTAFGATSHPDGALLRLQEFISRLPAGVQLFSLFQSNADLLDLVAEIMGTTPRLAEHLARTPTLLDHVLDTDFYDDLGSARQVEADLERHLVDLRDAEDLYDRVRRWTHDREFQLGVHLLRGMISPGAAAAGLTALTDAVLQALLPRVTDEFALQHGSIPGSDIAVLALGKYGARELNFGSDLDLVFVYRHEGGESASDGRRPLPPSLYYTRLCQRFVNALTTMTNAGRLFEIDMRLRPSGNAGPLASELTGFLRYQAEEAWTWEHLALTKLRVVYGEPDLAAAVETGVRAVLERPRDAGEVATAVRDMRQRIGREHPPLDRLDVKYAHGGLIELDFLAQGLQLIHGAQHPEVLATSSTDSLQACARVGLLGDHEAEELIAAGRLMQDVQGVIRLAMARPARERDMPRPLRDLMARITGLGSFETLASVLDAAQGVVRAAFVRHIEDQATASNDKET
jgi:[glutamine synthetase] adenylyltransferase / [glutamine synthetase]-adenylyl-L-tyrosine phosphorylase